MRNYMYYTMELIYYIAEYVFKLFIQRANNVQFYDGFYEGDNNHNWFNLAFITNSIDKIYHYPLEDNSG